MPDPLAPPTPPTDAFPVHIPVSDHNSKQSQRIRIQRSLIYAAQQGEFFQVSYVTTTGLPTQVDPQTATRVPPASALCNEIPSSTFELDRRMGRRVARRRTTWNFEVLCRWDVEVILEVFEQWWADNTLVLPEDVPNRLGQVRLNLLRSEPSHPVIGQPAVGTLCKFFFQAETGFP